MQIGTIKTFIARMLFYLLTEGENIQPRKALSEVRPWLPGCLSGRYTSVTVKSLGSAEEEADEIQWNALQRSD